MNNTVILIVKVNLRFSVDLQRITYILLHLSDLRSQSALPFLPLLSILTSIHLHSPILHPASNQLHHFLNHLPLRQSLETFPEILAQLQ